MKSDYEEYLEWEKKSNSRWNRVSKQIKAVHLLGILVLIALGNYWVSTGRIDSNLFWGILIAFGALILFLTFRESVEPQLIPEHIIKQIAQEALDKKRRLGIEIPFDAKARVTLVGEGIWEQDFISKTSGLIKREVGFEMTRKGYIKKGVIGVHPYSGIILGIRWEKFGYSGKESKDRTIIPAGIIGGTQLST